MVFRTFKPKAPLNLPPEAERLANTQAKSKKWYNWFAVTGSLQMTEIQKLKCLITFDE